MKVVANKVIEILKEETYKSEAFKITKVSLKKADGSGVQPALDFFKKELQANPIVETKITVNKDVTIKLQSNIINLPLLYPAPLEKVTESEKEYDVNIYAVLEAEDINASHLRIDQLGTADQLLKDDTDVKANFRDWVLEQFDRLDHQKDQAAKDEK